MNEKMNAGTGRFRQKVLAFTGETGSWRRYRAARIPSACYCFCVNWQQNLGSMSLRFI